MKSSIFVLSFAALVVCTAGGYAANRYLAAQSARDEREQAEQEIRKAVTLAADHPSAFGSHAAVHSGDASLKLLIQELATSHNVSLGYLSESERDTEKGRRERQVLARLVNAAHQNLVLFLQDMEARGGGAKVKELHVRPSRDISDAYEEVEVVFSKTVAVAEAKKP